MITPKCQHGLVNRAHQIHGARSIPACAGEPGGGATRDKIQGVYPRVCGGTTPWSRLCSRPIGLSPRVRGNPPLGLAFAGQQGSIPACAGEPGPIQVVMGFDQVYPRVCGGTIAAHRRHYSAEGLSPRVRGNQLNLVGTLRQVRSIPACAGEPIPASLLAQHAAVYPRVCGGTLSGPVPCYPAQGLSPRVRGNRPFAARVSGQRRSIPACAEEPRGCQSCAAVVQVYPRVCGGTETGSPVHCVARCLSPRVRRNRCHHLRGKVPQRSISACAGEPQSSGGNWPARGVYPRVCGGTRGGLGGADAGRGLSPRVRGNRWPSTAPSSRWRSIPACAGEPGVLCHPGRGTWVYPRVCGGTRRTLPPRAQLCTSRSIPACAGEPG